MIKLKSLLKDLDYTTQGKLEDLNINKVVIDSRLVEKGDLFVAIPGTNQDGHHFVKDALERGAGVIICEKDVDIYDSIMIKVEDSRKASALIARNLYQEPSKKIKVIGITGTNGKTTISYLLESIFRKAAFKTGVIGTITYKVGDKKIEACNTTPSPLILQGLIRKMVDDSLDYCVMEVSSHALDQHRTDYIDFDTALFTNATREHLDYHKNFTNYLDSKLSLFRGLGKDRQAILNRDDPNFSKVEESSTAGRILTFGIREDADVYADNIRLKIDGSLFDLHTKNKTISIESRLIGMHNISNMLAAACCAMAEGIGLEAIREGLEGVKEIEGRLQSFDTSGEIRVFIDYAHTDDALLKVLTALNGLKRRRVITVFGCGGDRDRGKRPKMGKIATRLSDYTIITSDNPRNEEPEGIVSDILKGIEKGFKNFAVILDRQKAIEEALSYADDGDIVLIAGKGHERYQIIKNAKIPFDDMKTAKEFFKAKRCLI